MPGERISQIAHELGCSVVPLLKIAKRLDIGDRLTPEEKAHLVSEFSGFYALENTDIRQLEDYLKSEQGQSILGRWAPVLAETDQSNYQTCMRLVAEDVYNSLEDGDLKNKLKPESVLETIMNLGVVEMHRSNTGTPPDTPDIPMELLTQSPDLLRSFVQRRFERILERSQIKDMKDFAVVKKQLHEIYENLMTQYGKD